MALFYSVRQLEEMEMESALPLWRQILADMLNIPLSTVENVDSSLGSAMLAGVAAGIFADYRDAADRCVHVTGVTEPDPEGAAF